MEAMLANRISMENTGGGQGNPEQGSFYSRPAEGVGIAQMKRSKIVPETSRPFGESLDIRESPEEEKDVGCGLQRERVVGRRHKQQRPNLKPLGKSTERSLSKSLRVIEAQELPGSRGLLRNC